MVIELSRTHPKKKKKKTKKKKKKKKKKKTKKKKKKKMDLIKSGGNWSLHRHREYRRRHPEVAGPAAIAVPHEKWASGR